MGRNLILVFFIFICSLAYSQNNTGLGGWAGYYIPALDTVNKLLGQKAGFWFIIDQNSTLESIKGAYAYSPELMIGLNRNTCLALNQAVWDARTSVTWNGTLLGNPYDTNITYNVKLKSVILGIKYYITAPDPYSDKNNSIFAKLGAEYYDAIFRGENITNFHIGSNIFTADIVYETKGTSYLPFAGAGFEFQIGKSAFAGIGFEEVMGTVSELKYTSNTSNTALVGQTATYDNNGETANIALELTGARFYFLINYRF